MRTKSVTLPNRRSNNFKDLSGRSFELLTAIEPVDKIGSHVRWSCKCKCGNIAVVRGSYLSNGHTTSCGCKNKRADWNKTHGNSGPNSRTTEYVIWVNMIQRCSNTNNPAYSFYGERGIKVCKRWIKFENFLHDMGVRPKGLSLDRINNNKGYSPSNCRWATPLQQANNRRNTKTKKEIL